MASLLFVCFSNRFRSVVAEHLFRNMMLKENGELAQTINVSSGGIYPRECIECLFGECWTKKIMTASKPLFGKSSNPPVLAAMAEKGIDISSHRSREVTKEMIEKSDLIITALKVHKQGILTLFPASNGRVFTLLEFARRRGNNFVDDCYTMTEWVRNNDCGDHPDMVNLWIAEIEQSLKQAMPRLVDYLQKGNKTGNDD